MYKVKIAIGVIVCTILASYFTAISYIDSLSAELEQDQKQILELKDINKHKQEEISRLKKDLQIKKYEIENLKESNSELSKKNKKIEKKLSEMVCPSGNIDEYTPVRVTMTFYGDFAHENGGYNGIDANGNKLVSGTVASNYYRQGTKFICNGKTYTVRDKGGSNFNNPNRLDVFVQRYEGESNRSYSKRISDYGMKTVTMYKR